MLNDIKQRITESETNLNDSTLNDVFDSIIAIPSFRAHQKTHLLSPPSSHCLPYNHLLQNKFDVSVQL